MLRLCMGRRSLCLAPPKQPCRPNSGSSSASKMVYTAKIHNLGRMDGPGRGGDVRLLPCGREVRAGRRGLRAGRALPLLLALRLVRGLRGPLQVPRVPRLPQAPTDAVIDLDGRSAGAPRRCEARICFRSHAISTFRVGLTFLIQVMLLRTTRRLEP